MPGSKPERGFDFNPRTARSYYHALGCDFIWLNELYKLNPDFAVQIRKQDRRRNGEPDDLQINLTKYINEDANHKPDHLKGRVGEAANPGPHDD
jgi:hypothetical protein